MRTYLFADVDLDGVCPSHRSFITRTVGSTRDNFSIVHNQEILKLRSVFKIHQSSSDQDAINEQSTKHDLRQSSCISIAIAVCV
jgi:hypothetical protein